MNLLQVDYFALSYYSVIITDACKIEKKTDKYELWIYSYNLDTHIL